MTGYKLNSQPPTFAVLLAAYNGIEWIDEQIQSILEQKGVAVTIWISVDRSTDSTAEVCEQYAAAYENIQILPFGGPFGGAARNFFYLIQMVELTTYDYVAFSDQDDVWHSDKLLKAVDYLVKSGDGGYSSNVNAFWPNKQRMLLDKAQPQVSYDYLFESAGPGCTYVLPASTAKPLQMHIIAVAEYLKEVDFHDWFVYAWTRGRGLQWYIDPRPSLEYRQHLNNQLGANTTIKSFIKRWLMIDSGGWFAQVKLIANLTKSKPTPTIFHSFAFSRMDLLKLAIQASKCRRRGRDKILFFLACVITALGKNN